MNQPGATVINDRYEILRRVGRGGMADVFLSTDRLLDRQVAVKILFPEFAVDPNFVERFRREAQAAANLSHPNIVNVYDWGKHAGTYFIAMEYVHGRTLADILKTNERLTPKQGAEIASEVAGALGFAHEAGLAHRDIKPANILIGANGQVKVADFGIARAMNSAEGNLTQAGSVMGTASYFSPEQAQGAQPDPRSDLYSLGIVMYEMVSGKPPFVGENPVSIAYKQVHDQPRPLNQLIDGIPRAYEAVVAKLLAKDPKLRYPSAHALRDDLRRFRNGEQVQALVAAAARPADALVARVPAQVVDTTPMMSPRPVAPTQPQVAGAPTAVVHTDRDVYMDEYPPGSSADARYYNDQHTRTGWYALAAFIALISIAAGGVVLYQQLTGGRAVTSGLTLADYRGMSLRDAQADLRAKKFNVTPKPVPDPAQPVDTVYKTEPAPGEIVPIGSTVVLWYNPGSASVQVPSVDGRNYDDAVAMLKQAGFETRSYKEDSDKVNEGLVIRTDPPGGTWVPQTQVINVVVSAGPTQVAIPPSILNMSEADATALLENDYQLVVEVQQKEDAQIEVGKVIDSNPKPNTFVERGSTITLIVSSGPGKVEVPSLAGLSEADARAKLSSLNLLVSVQYVQLPAGDPNDGRVTEQNMTPGASIAIGTTVEIVVGKAAAPVVTTAPPPPVTTVPVATTPTGPPVEPTAPPTATSAP